MEVYYTDAKRLTSNIRDFQGSTEDWKLAFYEVWRYQMTWSFMYEIAVRESRKNGVFIDILYAPDFEKSLLNALEDLGYRNVKISDCKVAEISAYDLNDCSEVEHVELVW